jgi:ribosomal protein S18 acetylase RimI-like enzyme
MWLIHVNGETLESDDFLVSDLEAIEKATGIPWSIANPVKNISVAKAFLAVALKRQGRSDRDVATELGVLTLRSLKTTFDYKPDDIDAEVVDPDPLPTASPPSTGRKSSRGRPISGGSRPIPDESDSVTS